MWRALSDRPFWIRANDLPPQGPVDPRLSFGCRASAHMPSIQPGKNPFYQSLQTQARNLGIPIISTVAELQDALTRSDIVLDAIFGTRPRTHPLSSLPARPRVGVVRTQGADERGRSGSIRLLLSATPPRTLHRGPPLARRDPDPHLERGHPLCSSSLFFFDTPFFTSSTKKREREREKKRKARQVRSSP